MVTITFYYQKQTCQRKDDHEKRIITERFYYLAIQQSVHHTLHSTAWAFVPRQRIEGTLRKELAARWVEQEIDNHKKHSQNNNTRHDNSLDG